MSTQHPEAVDPTALPPDVEGDPILDSAPPPEFEELVSLTHRATELDPTAEPVLTVRDLKMHFPLKSSLVRRTR